MFDDISDSYPAISDTNVDPQDRQFFETLPPGYQAFLQTHNGGSVEDFRYSFLTGVPFKTEEVDNPSRDDCPVQFFGIPTTDAGGESPPDLLQVVVDYEAEGFLPEDVIAIARCVQSSLVCISLRADDFGRLYYWDWYWRYPWCEAFFDARVTAAAARFENTTAILADPEHPEFQVASDALNFATLVELAPGFEAWFQMCEDHRSQE